MIVGARKEKFDYFRNCYWEFPTQPCPGFAENDRGKYPVSGRSLTEEGFLMSDVREEILNCVERKVTVTQITTYSTQSMQRSISEHLKYPALKKIGYSCSPKLDNRRNRIFRC